MKIFWSDVALRFWFCGWWIVTSVVYKAVWMYVSVLSIEEEKTEALSCISLSLLQKRINHEVSVVFFKRIVTVLFSSVQLLSCVQLFVTPWTAVCQASLSITNSQSLLTFPLSQWCHPTISSSVVPFSSYLRSSPASGSFPASQFFASVAKVLEFQLQHQSFQWTPRTNFL